MRRLVKIHSGSEMTLVKYTKVEDKGGSENVTLESADPPLKGLLKALDAMGNHLVEACELPEDWLEDIDVRGVSVTWKDEVPGIVISAIRKLQHSNSQLNIHTPPFEPKGACKEALTALTREALAYVDGKRGQLDLGLETTNEKKPA